MINLYLHFISQIKRSMLAAQIPIVQWITEDRLHYIYLEGKSERLVSGSGWRNNGVKSLQKSHSTGISLLPLGLPSLVPGHLVRGVDHVVPVPARDGDEGDSHGIITDLLDKVGHLLLDFLKPGLAVGRLGGVHLVTGNNELLDTKGVGEESVFSGLSVLGDTSLELSSSRGNDQHTTV